MKIRNGRVYITPDTSFKLFSPYLMRDLIDATGKDADEIRYEVAEALADCSEECVKAPKEHSKSFKDYYNA